MQGRRREGQLGRSCDPFLHKRGLKSLGVEGCQWRSGQSIALKTARLSRAERCFRGKSVAEWPEHRTQNGQVKQGRALL